MFLTEQTSNATTPSNVVTEVIKRLSNLMVPEATTLPLSMVTGLHDEVCQYIKEWWDPNDPDIVHSDYALLVKAAYLFDQLGQPNSITSVLLNSKLSHRNKQTVRIMDSLCSLGIQFMELAWIVPIPRPIMASFPEVVVTYLRAHPDNIHNLDRLDIGAVINGLTKFHSSQLKAQDGLPIHIDQMVGWDIHSWFYELNQYMKPTTGVAQPKSKELYFNRYMLSQTIGGILETLRDEEHAAISREMSDLQGRLSHSPLGR